MYAVEEAILLNRDGEEYSCYFILKDGLPIYEVNRWLVSKGVRAVNTSKKYANELCSFFNFLFVKNIEYHEVTRKDIYDFVDELLFSTSDNTLSLRSNITYQTASSYIMVIKEFYKHLGNVTDNSMKLLDTATHKNRIHAKDSFLYGQIWTIEVNDILDIKLPRMKETKEHIKWYSQEEIDAILSQFYTLRDKAIFLLTLEGMRISEVLNLKMEDYLEDEKIIHVSKTKGNKERNVPLKTSTVKMLEDYLYSERSLVEEENGIVDDLFLNLRKGKKFGKKVGYRNILSIIKNSANRAGLDDDLIRSHSGRSTRTMELLHFQSEHPEENLTDEQIRLLMGWSSSKSLDPYVNVRDERLLIAVANKINKEEDSNANDDN